jgi:type II secretory pathway pseudopilin PulG
MPRSRRTAFTLVEIIIVLGIILLLMGLLFPLIGRAREAGKRATCLSNLRSLTQAWIAYAGDNYRQFCSSDPTVAPGWYNRVAALDPNHVGPIKSGALYPYVNNVTPFRCPDDSSDPTNQFAAPSSYAINGTLNGPIGIPFTLTKFDDIQRAPSTFVFIEQYLPPGDNVMAQGTGRTNVPKSPGCFATPLYPAPVVGLNAWPGKNHPGTNAGSEGTGISFADGHAIFWKYADPRTGNVAEAAEGNLNGPIIVTAGGTRLYPNAYLTNSPDVTQLEIWSGGPIPPGVTP